MGGADSHQHPHGHSNGTGHDQLHPPNVLKRSSNPTQGQSCYIAGLPFLISDKPMNVRCAMCGVLCAVCYVLCAVCYVLCAMCGVINDKFRETIDSFLGSMIVVI